MKSIKHTIRGIAAVELAIVLPFLVLLFLLGIDLARTIYQYNELVANVRDAGKYIASYTRPINCSNTADPSVIDYKTAITETKNLAFCGSIVKCDKPNVTGINANNIVIEYITENNLTMVKVKIVNIELSKLTSIFTNSLKLGEVSSTFFQYQLDSSCNIV